MTNSSAVITVTCILHLAASYSPPLLQVYTHNHLSAFSSKTASLTYLVSICNSRVQVFFSHMEHFFNAAVISIQTNKGVDI